MTAASRTALLLIDLQRSFCDDAGSMAQQGRPIGPMPRCPNLAKIGALRADSFDAGLADGLGVAPGDIVIDKARYSALYGTSLEVWLRAADVARIIVGGVTTSMCVELTVCDLGQCDYEVIVAREACADFAAERHAASLEAMAFGFASVASVAECIARLEGREA